MGILNRSSIPCVLFILYIQPGNIKSLIDDIKLSSEQLRSPNFSHLAVDREQKNVFIGAGDRLYKLLPNLTALANVSITWNITNMFINDKAYELIVCGGDHSGYWCRFYSLKDPFSHGGDKVVGDIKRTCTNAPMVNLIKNNYSTQNNPNLKNDLELCFANSYCENFSEVSALLVKKIANIPTPVAKSASSPENNYTTEYRNDYQVTYKYGFTSGKYHYILTTQRNYATLQPSHISKLIRICYNGESLWQGYTEIPIQCKSNNKNYNSVQTADVGKASSQLAKSLTITPDSDVLFAVFLRDQPANNSSGTRDRESALCVYSLEAINKKFIENIQYCFNGYGSRGFNTTVPNPNCTLNSEKIDLNFCSSKVNMPYVGNKPITESPVLLFNAVPAAIATKQSEEHHDVFIGFTTGHLKKIEVHNSTNICQEADLIIDEGSSVNFDLMFSPNNDYLYVMTERTLTRMKIPFNLNCSEYHEISSCFQNAPMYCGWCGLMNKCTTNCDCLDDKLAHWYASDFRKEIKITSNSSNEFQIGPVGNIQLNLTNLPQFLNEISCNFTFSENKNLVTSGRLDRSSAEYILAICDIPEAKKIPKLPKNEHYRNATLSISAIHVPDIVKTNVKFFDCETYTSCKACNSSEFSCMWSPKENKCKFEAITGYAQNKSVKFESNAIIPARQPTVIKFPNMKSYDVCETTSNLKCLISIEGNNFVKNVTIKNDDFYCENATYKYAQKTWNATAKVAILWNTSTFSDILSSTNVVVYKCQQMAHNCNNCLTLDTKYKCRWCQHSNKCEFQDHCADLLMADYNTCPRALPPSISSFSPQKGPLEGGTNVTIEGESLGYIFQDITQDIEVAGVPCVPIRNVDFSTKSITCTIKKSSALPTEGPVVVHVNNESIISKQNFKFADPKISNFFPDSGPIYGNAELTIKGEDLDVGKLIQVFIGNILCLIFSLTSFEIKCVTNSSVETNATVSVKFDQSVRNFTNDTYKYRKDPERDEKGFNIQPKGIPAGGVTILLRHVTPMSPQEIIFRVHDNDLTYNSTCKVQHDSTLKCPSPPIPNVRTESIDAKNPKKLEFSIADNVSNESIKIPKSQTCQFLLYPNPEFYDFLDSSVEIDDESFVIVNGKNINKACHKTDIRVIVGNHSCKVISISSNQLICRLPKLSSSLYTDDSDEKYDIFAEYGEITVSIGTKFSVIVPRKSSTPVEPPKVTFLKNVVIILIIISIVLITSIAFLCLISKKRVSKTVKKLKNTRLQMTRLELRVASECKEAFAELQTQPSASIVADSGTHLPFLNYHDYIINILFPNINDHSFILNGKAILIHKENGLRLFEELIMNRRFLLTFVRTLENQANFSMNDRVYVASMLMITLQKDMEYCTNILKTLLAELIEKNMRGKSHPKLLLRRTESIVEKMLSAWFSFLLYKFLKKSAGQPLFNLFNAIKEHVNRGPVDMITSHARYCLSDNKILRLKFDYRPLTIYVTISQHTAKIIDLESAIEKIPVQALDCDTISQFKDKAVDAIHREINFTRIINPSELNVKWFRDTTSRFILSDDDSSSITEGEWRRKNTLNHYNIPDGCVLNLISDKEINYRTLGMMPSLNGNELKNNIKLKSAISMCTTRKKSLTESTTALIPANDVHFKEWHLIKPFSSQNDEADCNESHEMMPEIYLTRILATKSSLQKFVDELFNVIFKKTNQSGCFPIAIKYMFDFLDDQAHEYNITDPEVVHVWKNNCLPLRFWVNLIKNPNFLFDVHKSNVVDSCLSVIAQVFMDSCSISEQHFNKDSATTKLLYAKEIPIYSKLVKKYYADIKHMSRISAGDMNTMLAKVSKKYTSDFDTNMSIHELFKYATKYKEELIDALKNDEFSKDNLLVLKLEEVMEIISTVSNL